MRRLPPRAPREGSAYLLTLGTLAVIFILGFSFIRSMLDEYFQSHYHGDSVAAYYLAEAGVERAIFEFKAIFEKPLLLEDGTVHADLLRILDFTRAQDYTLELTEKLGAGSYHVRCEFVRMNRTPFHGYLFEKGLPTELEPYFKDTKNYNNPARLAGWQAELKITSTGEAKGRRRTLVVTKDVKVMDLTPPASEYSLFIWGSGTDFLRGGTFLLEHGLAHLVEIAQGFLDDYNRLAPYLAKGDIRDLVNIVRDFVVKTKFSKPKEKKMEEIFKAYQHAGRVRVNGTLHVWLPFFEVDDVINYFVSNNYYEKPEVGYPGCDNRLHDRFMSWATKFEGDVRKHYFELVPYVIQNQKPTAKVEQYTRWSTFPNFTRQYPDEKMPDRLESIEKNAEKYSCQTVNGNLTLFGTQAEPRPLDGIVYVKGNCTIGGFFTGRGMVVAEGDVHFSSDVRLADKEALLTIVSTGGRGILPKGASRDLQAALALRESVQGGDRLRILGNLTVKSLNRQRGELGDPIMARSVRLRYDKRIRQIRGDNFWVSISKRDTSRVEVGE